MGHAVEQGKSSVAALQKFWMHGDLAVHPFVAAELHAALGNLYAPAMSVGVALRDFIELEAWDVYEQGESAAHMVIASFMGVATGPGWLDNHCGSPSQK